MSSVSTNLQTLQHSKEVDPHCRQAIVDQHRWINAWSAPKTWVAPHVFGDLTRVVPDLPTHGDFASRVHHINKADTSEMDWCYTHGCYCPAFPPKPDLISISRGYRARRILLQCVANMFPVNWVIYYQFDSFPTFSTKTPLISASPVICHPRNSRANCNRKYMNGRFANVYGVWGKRHRELRTPLVVLENTEETHPRTHRHFVGEGS